jgi:copper chaperone NosL
VRPVLEIAAAIVLAATAACGASADGPPAILVDRTACAHCGMLVSEPAYAAAYRAPGGEARVFDDIACLLAAAREEPAGTALRFWFHDAATAAWMDGSEAVFVRAAGLRTPMGGGVVAFRDPAAARDAAGKHNGGVIPSLDELRRQNRQGEP